jgi:hypothetical protein
VSSVVTEEFEEWLRKTEIPTDVITREKYLQFLEDELGIHGESLDVAARVYDRDLALQPTGETLLGLHGIRGLTIPYPWGREVRYGIQGLAGLFGWAVVQLIREAEEW